VQQNFIPFDVYDRYRDLISNDDGLTFFTGDDNHRTCSFAILV